MESDYRQAGMTYDPPGVRISRLQEGLKVIKGCSPTRSWTSMASSTTST
jgi:hypothetical protein